MSKSIKDIPGSVTIPIKEFMEITERMVLLENANKCATEIITLLEKNIPIQLSSTLTTEIAKIQAKYKV